MTSPVRLPSPLSVTLRDGVVTAAYHNDEDAKIAFDIVRGEVAPAGLMGWVYLTVGDFRAARSALPEGDRDA